MLRQSSESQCNLTRNRRPLVTDRQVCQLEVNWVGDDIPYPEGPTYTTIMELGPQNQNRDGFLGGLIP